MTINDPQNLTYPNSDLIVTVNHTPCTITSGSYPLFVCTLPINVDGTAKMPGGSYDASVYVNGMGYITKQAGVPQLDFPFGIDSVTPNKTECNGGINI